MGEDDLISQFLGLPGIKGWKPDIILTVNYQIAYWGKEDNSKDDYHIIASTTGFPLNGIDYSKHFYLGNAAKMSPTLMWRSHNGTAFATLIRQGQKSDSQNRPILEALIFKSDSSSDEIPFAMQALLFLPYLSNFVMTENWVTGHKLNEDTGQSKINWEDDLESDNITSSNDTESLPDSDIKELLSNFCSKIDFIRENFSKNDLQQFYEIILQKDSVANLPIVPKNVSLPIEIFSVLLAFLPNNYANSVSLIEKIPSTKLVYEKFQRNWHGVLSNDFCDLFEKQKLQSSPGIQSEARSITDRLFAFTTSNYSKIEHKTTQLESSNQNLNHSLTLWGPPGSGKTVYLAQLYLQNEHSDLEWNVIIGSEEAKKYFKDMRKKMRDENRFPDATVEGHVDQIHYRFVNKCINYSATLQLEDRAGSQYQDLTKEILDLIIKSDGLLLLFDPTRDPATLEREVFDTLESIHLKSENQHENIKTPIAIGLSKADYFIKNKDDLVFAQTEPEKFARKYVDSAVISGLDKYCENYRLFPISAAGIRIDRNQIEPTGFYDDALQSRIIIDKKVRSINLLTPILWLIEEISSHEQE